MFPVEVKISHNRKSFKQYLKKVAGCKGSTKATEKKFYNILFGLLPKIYMPKHKIKYIRREKYAQNKIRHVNISFEKRVEFLEYTSSSVVGYCKSFKGFTYIK